MEGLKEIAKADGERAREVLPSQIEGLNDFIKSSFSSSLESVEKTFSDAISAAKSDAALNQTLSALHSAVRSKLAVSIDLLLALHRWVLAHVPQYEEGSGYFQMVQQEVVKLLKESIERLEKAIDALPEYYEKRSGLWEKLAAKQERTSKKSTSSTKTQGGKEGPEDKSSSSEESSESRSEGVQSPDGLKALLAIDVACYVSLHRKAQLARDLLLFCGDVVEQNIKKITLSERSGGSKSGSAFMF